MTPRRSKRALIVASNRRRKRAIEQDWYIDIGIACFILAFGFWSGQPAWGIIFGVPLLAVSIAGFGRYPKPGPARKAMWDRLDKRLAEIDKRFGS